MRGLKGVLFLMFFLPCAIANPVAPAQAEISNRLVAIVNGEVITLYELNGKIKEFTGLTPAELRSQDDDRYIETRRKILDLLIDDKIASEKIRELGIQMTPKEVDEAIEKVKRDNGLTHEALIAGLEREGISYESYRENVKKELERMQLINLEVKSRIIISEEKILQYYHEHEDEFTSEERVHLAAIVLLQQDPADQAEARALYEQSEEILFNLRNGEDFSKLAAEFSKGPGADEGGDLGFFKTSQLDPELMKVVEGLAVGEFSKPIVRPSGIQIIRLLERQEQQVKPLSDVRESIQGVLYRDEINKRYAAWIKDLREKAYIKIIF